MNYPTLPQRPLERRGWQVFRGLNRNEHLSDGELEDMENLTSDGFPVLSVRRGRAVAAEPASPQGLIAKEMLCYVDGSAFVAGDTRVELGLSVQPEDCPKKLIGMGAWVIILPDKKYINTADLRDYGSIEAENTALGAAWTLCDGEGNPLGAVTAQPAAPEPAENGDLWLDTGSQPNVLRRYASAQGQWVTAQAQVKLTAEGIGAGLQAGDGVNISGSQEEGLNGSHILTAVTADTLVFPGVLAEAVSQSGPVTVGRSMPDLDHCIESGNRLWGCRYGLNSQGQPVNEIYASALGDFKNWEKFQGLASDSYRASCGADGPFTGAVNHLGYPLFFREGCLHKIYGTEPSSFQIQTIPCRGVQRGCAGSLAVVGELLLYRSRSGYCGYDGSTPVLLSQALGREGCTAAAAGALGDKYYVSQQGKNGWELLVYDTALGLWHREDSLHCTAFAALEGELYAIDGEKKNILALLGTVGTPEGPVNWSARTGPLGSPRPERKYISRLTLEAQLEAGSRLEIQAEYDSDGVWETLAMIFSRQRKSFVVPMRPRRCGHLRLRLLGRGGAKVYAVTAVLEKGSDHT